MVYSYDRFKIQYRHIYQVPFVAESKSAIIHKHLASNAPRVSLCCGTKDLPLALDRIIEKLLEKGAKDRYVKNFSFPCYFLWSSN